MAKQREMKMNGSLHPAETALYQNVFGYQPTSVIPLPKSGSSRVYFRLHGPQSSSVILCRSDNVEENRVFIELCNAFYDSGLNVPKIIAVADDFKSYLQSDLGSLSLYDLVTDKIVDTYGVTSLKPETAVLTERTLNELIRFQSLPSKEWKDKVGFPPLGSELINYDFRYFLDQFVIPSGIKFDEIGVLHDLESFGDCLQNYPEEISGFMYRDFQSRNVMLVHSDSKQTPTPFFIDFQSGRKGPCVYDLVSFVWQAKAAYSEAERNRFVTRYAEHFAKVNKIPEELILDSVPLWASFRVMQVLGAYGLRGLKEKKQHFIDSIPYAVNNLYSLFSSEPMNKYSFLLALSESLLKKFS